MTFCEHPVLSAFKSNFVSKDFGFKKTFRPKSGFSKVDNSLKMGEMKKNY